MRRINWLRTTLSFVLMIVVMLSYGGLCNKKSDTRTGSSTPSVSTVTGQVYILTSNNNIVPVGGATVLIVYSNAPGRSILSKSASDNSKSARTKSDGTYEIPDIPLDSVITVTISSSDTIQSTEVLTASATAVNSSAILKGRGKKIGLIKKNQETVLNTFDDDTLPKCQITVPANAVTNDVDDVYLTPVHQGENLSPIPDGYVFIAGADFSAPSPVAFAAGKEATPYIILPDHIRAEELSSADIKLMEFIDGNWVITTPGGKGKVHTTGEWSGYIGPDDTTPAKLKGVRPWAWVKTQPTAASISGTVKDASGVPIEGAFIFGGSVRTHTGPGGTYTLQNISVIRNNTLVTLDASAEGYQLNSQFVSISPGATVTNVDFTLEQIAAAQSAEVYGRVTDSSDSSAVYGAIITLQTTPGIRGMRYDDKGTPTDLTDDTFYVIPPPGVVITQYKWMLTLPGGTKFTSALENGASVVLNQLATEATNAGNTLNVGAYKVELEVTYAGGKVALVSGGFLLRQSGLVLYIADIRLPISLEDQLTLKAMTDAAGNYRFINLPIGETFMAWTKADGFIGSNTIGISALASAQQKEQNFALSALATDTTPPAQPAGLTGTVQSAYSIRLTWSASADDVGIDYYRVYRNGTEVGKTTATTYLDSGLTAATVYTYIIGAFDKANNSALSSSVSITTPGVVIDNSVPGTPTNLAATAVSPSQINLHWQDNAANEDGYIIERSTDGTNFAYLIAPGMVIIQIIPPPAQVQANETAYSDTIAISATTTYYYRIYARTAAGQISGYSNIISATTPATVDVTAPTVPGGLTATAVSQGQINLSWNTSTDTGGSGLAGYKIYRNNVYLISVANTSYSDSGLSASMTYTYKIAAYDTAGNSSAQSGAVSATTQDITGGSSVPGCVAWWKFDETSGTTAADASGNGNNGTVYGPTWSGGALSFDGADDYVNMGNAPSLSPGSGDYTVGAWFKTNATTAPMTIFNHGTFYDQQFIDIGSAATLTPGVIRAAMTDADNDAVEIITSPANEFNNNTWHHVVMAYKYSTHTLELFVDGVFRGTNTNNLVGAMNPTVSAEIGRMNGARYFSGFIDDVKIYNYARTAEQILAEYNVSTAAYWTQKITQGAAGSPSDRYSMPMVWDGNKVIAFGGINFEYRNNELWWYYPITNTWVQQTPAGGPPAVRCAHSMVWDGTKVIMFGGNITSYNIVSNDLWWYYPITNTWVQKIANGVGGSPVSRSQHAMVWDGTKGIMFGGYNDGVRMNDLWWYDPVANTWTQKTPTGGPPSARYAHSMVWDGTKVIMFGGSDGTNSFNDLWWYEPGTNTWTQKIANGAVGVPSARAGHQMVWDGTRSIMFSGYEEAYQNALWWYDSGTNTWTEKIANGLPGSPPGKSGHSMVWDGIRVIMFGGCPAPYTYSNDLWWYEPNKPVAWWKFDETSGVVANDVSGNNNHGTVYGATWSNGRLSFDGVDDYVALPSTVLNNMPKGTVSAWIKANNFNLTGGANPLIIDKSTTGSIDYFNLQVNDSTKVGAATINGGYGTAYWLQGASILQTATWYYVVMTWDGTQWRMYINGTLDASYSSATGIPSNNTVAAIGRVSDAARGYFNGQIDDVRIYNYARTAAEIQTEYNARLKVIATFPLSKRPRDIILSPDGTKMFINTAVNDATAGEITVLSATNGTIIANISVGFNPMGIALTPDGQFGYVGNTVNGYYATKFNAANNTKIGDIGTGTDSAGMAITPDGQYCYMSNHWSSFVSVIRISDNINVGNISGIDSGCLDLAITPDGQYVYVLGRTGNIYKISTSNNQVISTLTKNFGGYGANVIVISPDGQYIYIVGGSESILHVYSTVSDTEIQTVAFPSNLRSVKVTPDGNYIYVTRQDGGLSVVSAANYNIIDTISIAGSDQLGCHTEGIVFSPNGQYAYIPNNVTSTIIVVDTNGFGGPLVVWEDGFETYTAGSFPSANWVSDAAGGSVDNTVAYSGSQSLKMIGVIGGSWGGLAYRPLQTTTPYDIELYLRNGSEALSGAHPDRGYVGLRKGTSWTNPSRQFLQARGTGVMEFYKVDGTVLTTTNYTTNTWYKIKIGYERPDASTVKITYWLNDIYIGMNTGAASAEENNLTNLDLTCQEGSAWFDDVKIYK
ncbi:MAG: LamG-like jellyroll fold domain-containing protein [Planctomycetota bacterium]